MRSCPVTGCGSATTRRSTRRSTSTRSVLANMKTAAPQLNDTDVRKVLGSFLFSGDDVDKPAEVLSGGEKTRLALAMLVVSSANVLLLDEPTNNLDPGLAGRGAGGDQDLRRCGRPGHPRRGRGGRARPRPGAAAARRHRGPVDPGVRRTDLAGLTRFLRFGENHRCNLHSREIRSRGAFDHSPSTRARNERSLITQG